VIDVVVVTADTREMTSECVASLEHERDLERVIVVDNASSDGTQDALRERFPAVAVARLDEGVGFARACNLGAAHGTAELVLFLNSDILTTPGAVAGLVEALADRPRAVLAGGRLVDPDTLRTQDAYRPRTFPSVATLATQLLGIEQAWPRNPIARRHVGSRLDDATTVAVQQPAAAAILVRRDAFERVGGFDERFWFWFEDSDLLARLHREGEILYVPSAAFRHLGGGTFRRWSKVERIRSLHHGMLHYADARLPRAQRAVVGAITVAVSVPRVVLFRRSRPDEARAWRDVLRAGGALIGGRRVPPLAGPPRS
jgi:N-acetylglucosaminyl-diphospho-decaprenol L-rhamnosyltransferase